MVAYTYRMPAGIPGDINRAFAATVLPEVITPSGSANAPTAYGIPIVIDATSGQVRMVAAGDTAINGLLARPYPTNSSTDPIGTSTPPAQGYCDRMVRGCMSVKLSGTQAAIKGGAVYVWTAAPSGNHITGGFEAANPGASGIAIPGAFFRGPADSNGITEIEYNL